MKKIIITLTILYPIILGFLLFNCQVQIISKILGVNFSVNCASVNKIIALGFCAVTLATNIYACGQDKIFEAVIGSMYASASILCILTEDFITMFIAIEMMMLFASALIFMGNVRESLRAFRQYFLTHLFSGSIMLIGIVYYITSRDTSIINLLEFLHNKDQEFFIYILIFIALLINIASFPFSGWMVNCYPAASNVSFVYLISFTTKVSLILLLKLFAGFDALKLFGMLISLYGALYACKESNIKRLICYINISQIGFIVYVIGLSEESSVDIVRYIFIHVLYNALFVLTAMIITDKYKIVYCKDIVKIRTPLLVTGLVIAVIMAANVPFSTSFMVKNQLVNYIPEDSYYVFWMLSILIFLMLPIKEYFLALSKPNITLKLYENISLIILISIIVLINIEILYQHIKLEGISNILKIEYFLSIPLGIVLCWFIKLQRTTTVIMNFDLLHIIANGFYHLHFQRRWLYSFHENEGGIISTVLREKEIWCENDIESWSKIKYDFFKRLTILHNQRVGIFSVFTILTVMIILLHVK